MVPDANRPCGEVCAECDCVCACLSPDHLRCMCPYLKAQTEAGWYSDPEVNKRVMGEGTSS